MNNFFKGAIHQMFLFFGRRLFIKCLGYLKMKTIMLNMLVKTLEL